MNPLVLAVALGCAPAPHAGELVQIADEQAVIVWNEQTKVEHFIRRARFATDAKDFGFLVPTPSQPTLAAADDSMFKRLIAATKPEERTETGFRLEPSLACLSVLSRARPTAAAPEAQHVAVLEIARVAGYDAAVLAADDATALQKWLDEHGYPASEALKSWLDVYVKQKWIVTAFKIARAPEKAADDVGTSAVRMTFRSEKPFYPYREPEGQTGGQRILEVFLVAPERMDGSVAAAPWSSTALYARREIDVAPFLPGVPDLPARAWLHRFVDFSSPRRGTADLFFDRSGASEVIPEPIVFDRRTSVPVPLDLIALLVAAIALTMRLRRRKTA